MTGTPDRFPGSRDEDELILRDQGADPTTIGATRYVSGDFRMRDSVGVFNPRDGGAGQGGTGLRIIQVSLTGDGQAIYQTVTQASWQVVGYMVFPGTTVWGTDGTNCAGFVAWLTVADATGISLRFYDATNSNVIATVTGITATVPTVYQAASVSNLPASAAVFEIQGKRDGSKNGAISVACIEKRSS